VNGQYNDLFLISTLSLKEVNNLTNMGGRGFSPLKCQI